MRSTRQSAPDLIGAVVLFVVGLAFVLGATGYGVFGEEGRIGPGFMPFVTGLLIAVFGAVIGVQTIFEGRRATRETGEISEEYEEGEEDPGSRLTVAIVFAMTSVAILLTSLLGFLAAFGMLVFALARFIEKGGWFVSAGLGVGAAVFTWLVFVVFLRIPLPMGIFGP